MDIALHPEQQVRYNTEDAAPPAPPIPAYLEQVYWWAYVNPRGIRIFDRPWLTNLILWGNFRRLRHAAVAALTPPISGRTLQIACVYGDFTPELVRALAPGGRLDVVDVVPDQLSNLAAKLPAKAPVTLHQANSAALPFGGAAFDQAVLFFLLHEQPQHVREATVAEAWRVLRPGGRLVVVDYHRPPWWHPLRYLFAPVLGVLEPFALDLWITDLGKWLPRGAAPVARTDRHYYGGLYQMAVFTRE